MQHSVLVALVLIIAAVVIAGCTQNQAPVATATPVPAGIPAAAATAVVPHPSFSLGDHYLQKSYSFQSESDHYTEQFHVDNSSWGIDFVVLPLNVDPQSCWFRMNVTNVDTGHTDTYGYDGNGNSYRNDTHQQYPMYTIGSYRIDMTGNLVKVDVTAAKRNP
ncbi:hypothetical protein [Methanoregula sp.]|jgi:hypothetical protein|uniref:hypothetical protein n=1 Tax=Methanoregula sp. TaxID=2052170 RepID=UPI003C74EE0A